MRWYIADYLAEERLPVVNLKVQKVYPKNSFYTRHGKRILDIIISLIALILTLPINLIIGIITLVDVGIPVFFSSGKTWKRWEKICSHKIQKHEKYEG